MFDVNLYSRAFIRSLHPSQEEEDLVETLAALGAFFVVAVLIVIMGAALT